LTRLRGATIAFDLDGTLVDTAPDLVGALNMVLADQGLQPVPYETARVMVGRGAKVLIERGYAATGIPLPEDLAPVLFSQFIDLYLARIAQESRPFEGVEATLDELVAEGAKLVICTNKRTDLSLALLDALDLTRRFTAVIGADKAPAAKPDGRHLSFAIEAGGGGGHRALMVGDSATDVGAARNAGVPVVVTSFGYTDIPPGGLGADAMIDHYAELPGLVRRMLGGGQ